MKFGWAPSYLCDIEKGRRHANPDVILQYENLPVLSPKEPT